MRSDTYNALVAFQRNDPTRDVQLTEPRAQSGKLACLITLAPCIIGTCADARARHGLEESLNFRSAASKLMRPARGRKCNSPAMSTCSPEVESRILDQLNKCYQQPPRMGPMHYETLQKHTSDLLLYKLSCSRLE